ncbi:MAG: type IV pilus twitching motility protein PilT [Acidobacteriota bacterium]|nr:type IV pilus twitching motility protein PilT [Acidobacteriota bacterium]
MAKIDQFFEILIERGGSDLHLEEGQPPKLREHGKLSAIGKNLLTRQFMSAIMAEICTPEQWRRFELHGDLDFAYAMGNKARFRANYFRHFHGYGAIFRIIPSKILTLEKLKAPEVFKGFAFQQAGLILITGPTGSGKSTTLAAIINHINETQVKKIMTIEDPVEFVHQSKKCLITHREVGEDTKSFATGLMSAIKSDVNVVLVGEMRDRETVELALTATEMGVLVFGTLHTNSAAKTLDRITDVFPNTQQAQIKGLLGSSLRAVVSQQLLRTADGKGRCAAHEILLHTPALTGIIRTGDVSALYSYIQTGRKLGMQTMDDCLLNLVKEKKVTKEEAYNKAQDKGKFA